MVRALDDSPVNINKLFPRLSIRAKLVIAFAGLSVLPLTLASAIGALITAGRIRAVATQTLAQDLARVEVQTTRSLREAERHVAFLAGEVLGPALLDDTPRRWAAAQRMVSSFLGPEPAFHAIKVVDLDGRVRFVSQAPERDVPLEESGVYYAWRAAAAAGGASAIFPVEVRESRGPGVAAHVVPAVAILMPVRDRVGAVVGAVVGEAYAAEVLGAIEDASPGFSGVTGLVDQRGAFLYHSERKRQWVSGLGSDPDTGLVSDLGADVARRILGGTAGTLRAAGHLVGHRPLALAAPAERLVVYRAVPISLLERPVRRFLGWTMAAVVLVVAGVLVLGLVAADQFSRPIYRLRAAARALAAGGRAPTLVIETNDEIEDLARDFERMDREIAVHREDLERLVAERTRALAAAHAELATVLDGSADAIVGLDVEGRIRVWNRGAAALFGWEEHEVLGLDAEAFIGPVGPGAEGERRYIASSLAEDGALIGHRTVRRHRDAGALPVSLTQTRLRDSEGRDVGTSLIVRDDRAQERLDDHLRRAERLAAVSVMATGLAHEIRNPLGIVANRIECMQKDAEDRQDEALIRDLAVLSAHVDRLRTLTTDLLRFARDENAAEGPVALGAVVSRLVSLLRRTIAARGIELRFEAAPDLPSVVGQEAALETVVLNLLINAADATPSGGTVTVTVRLGDARDAVEIEVRDTGTGIPPDVGGRIFEPFFTTKGPRGGTGLGLAVCRTVVERHRGTIRAMSMPGCGATFTVALPLAPPAVV